MISMTGRAGQVWELGTWVPEACACASADANGASAVPIRNERRANLGMTSSLVSPDIHWPAEKMGRNHKLSTGSADIKRHGVLIASGIFSKVLARISCATACAEGLA
jgi:hypothetical protein